MNRILLASIFILCLAATSACASDVKLGFIDMQRILNASEAGIEAKEQLAAHFTKYQQEITTNQDEIKKLKDELEHQGMFMSESTRSTKEKDYQQRLKEFQRFTKDAQEDLQGKDTELTRKIIKGMDKIVQEFSLKNNYNFIFVKNKGMLFADDKADVTDKIIKMLNANQKK